jgi:hypothetical protein
LNFYFFSHRNQRLLLVEAGHTNEGAAQTMGYPGMIGFIIPKKINFNIAPKPNLPYVK